jgi:hypothetical protein
VTTAKTSLARLTGSLLAALLLLGLLGWALFLPGRPGFRATRPPLVTPVSLDWLVEPKPVAAVVEEPSPSSSAAAQGRDGLKAW